MDLHWSLAGDSGKESPSGKDRLSSESMEGFGAGWLQARPSERPLHEVSQLRTQHAKNLMLPPGDETGLGLWSQRQAMEAGPGGARQ